MADTYRDKISAKFMNKLIDLKDVPMNIVKGWNRHNWQIGWWRYMKRIKQEKEQDKDYE